MAMGRTIKGTSESSIFLVLTSILFPSLINLFYIVTGSAQGFHPFFDDIGHLVVTNPNSPIVWVWIFLKTLVQVNLVGSFLFQNHPT